MPALQPSVATSPLQRLHLRLVTVGMTLVVMLCFMAVAALDHRAVRLALAGSVLTALHGLTWLFILRRNHAHLRRHGYRW